MSVLGLCILVVALIVTFVTVFILGTMYQDKQAHRARLNELERFRAEMSNESTPIWNAMVLEDPERYLRVFRQSLPVKDANDE